MRVAYCDLEQAESRVVGAICLRLFGSSTYLDACEGGDLHTSVCRMCWEELPWPSDFSLSFLQKGERFPPDLLSAAKKVASANAYRKMSFRDLAKRLGHGSNYYGQPPTMAQHSHVDVKTIQAFQRRYFTAFPAIPRWHSWVEETIQSRRELTTMLGRRIYVLKDPTASSTLREMIAYEPQSVGTGDYMNAGLTLLDQANLPLHLLQQVHDALAFEYDRRDEQWLIQEVCNIISWTFPLFPHPDRFTLLKQKHHLTSQETSDLQALETLLSNPRPFSIPVEAMVGWNLAKRITKDKEGNSLPEKEWKNLNGLIPFNPSIPDPRTRIPSQPVSFKERFDLLGRTSH